MNILSPSILSADFWNLGEQIREVERLGVKYLHIDVMDGVFVPSITYGMPLIASIRKHTDLFFDVHLMIAEPERYVEEFAESGADMITFHVEGTDQVEETIQKIRGCGRKVGISLCPATPVEAAEAYLEMVDMVLVMTVEPGFGGQKLISKCLDKVADIRRMVEARGLSTDIQVDGGVTLDNVEQVLRAGANVIVAGSAVFKNDMTVNVTTLLEKMRAQEAR